jgi:hypothetical protein
MSLLAVQGGATGTGTVTLLAPVTNTNQTLTLPDVTGTVAVQGGAGVGKVLQVVSATYSTTTTTTSSSYVTSNIQASITPSSSSSKIFIVASVPFATNANTQACLTIFRNNATDLSSSARGFGEQYSTVEIQAITGVSFLDSPATTSSTAYTVYFRAISATSCRTCPDSTQAVITLMEIAA